MKGDEEIARLRKLWSDGLSYTAISNELGWSKSTVERIAKKIGLRPRFINVGNRRRYTEQERQCIIDLRLAGASLVELSQEFNCSPSTASQICNGAIPRRQEMGLQIPPHVLADREYRLAQPARDLTGALMGDPPRGCSALEARAAMGRLG